MPLEWRFIFFLCLCETSLPCYWNNFELLPISISTCIIVILHRFCCELPCLAVTSLSRIPFISPILCRVNCKTKASVLNHDFAAKFILSIFFWAIEVEYLKIYTTTMILSMVSRVLNQCGKDFCCLKWWGKGKTFFSAVDIGYLKIKSWRCFRC